jgi:hypothetical protein
MSRTVNTTRPELILGRNEPSNILALRLGDGVLSTASKSGITRLSPRSEGPTHITSREFAEACASERIHQLFTQGKPNGLALLFYLVDNANLCVICSCNRLARQWSKLNSLIRFLRRHQFVLDDFTVSLSKATDQSEFINRQLPTLTEIKFV